MPACVSLGRVRSCRGCPTFGYPRGLAGAAGRPVAGAVLGAGVELAVVVVVAQVPRLVGQQLLPAAPAADGAGGDERRPLAAELLVCVAVAAAGGGAGRRAGAGGAAGGDAGLAAVEAGAHRGVRSLGVVRGGRGLLSAWCVASRTWRDPALGRVCGHTSSVQKG